MYTKQEAGKAKQLEVDGGGQGIEAIALDGVIIF